jgi:hypothetical protein
MVAERILEMDCIALNWIKMAQDTITGVREHGGDEVLLTV